MISHNNVIGQWELVKRNKGAYTTIATNFNPTILDEIKRGLEEKNKEESYFIRFKYFQPDIVQQQEQDRDKIEAVSGFFRKMERDN